MPAINGTGLSGIIGTGGEAGEARGTRGARGVVVERLIASGDDAGEGGGGDVGLEFGSGRDVHTTLRDPAGLEAAAGSDIEAGEETVDYGLIRIPARLRRHQRREERICTPEIIGLDESEALKDILALSVAQLNLAVPLLAVQVVHEQVELPWRRAENPHERG
nr:hypothetical protein CCACVL1_14809 [Ipomoea batatas]